MIVVYVSTCICTALFTATGTLQRDKILLVHEHTILMWCTYTITTTGWSSSSKTSISKKWTFTSYRLAIHSLQCIIIIQLKILLHLTTCTYTRLSTTADSTSRHFEFHHTPKFTILDLWKGQMSMCTRSPLFWAHHYISTRSGIEEIRRWNKLGAVSVDVSCDKTVSGWSLVWQEIGLSG